MVRNRKKRKTKTVPGRINKSISERILESKLICCIVLRCVFVFVWCRALGKFTSALLSSCCDATILCIFSLLVGSVLLFVCNVVSFCILQFVVSLLMALGTKPRKCTCNLKMNNFVLFPFLHISILIGGLSLLFCGTGFFVADLCAACVYVCVSSDDLEGTAAGYGDPSQGSSSAAAFNVDNFAQWMDASKEYFLTVGDRTHWVIFDGSQLQTIGVVDPGTGTNKLRLTKSSISCSPYDVIWTHDRNTNPEDPWYVS